MLTKKDKLILLERVINSSTFKKSQRNQDLLTYLINKEMDGVDVKESTIAIEFYKKNYDFNPNEETIVRVGIGSLRKRLERYFFTEGKDEKIKIEIPGGSYDIAYSENKVKIQNALQGSSKFVKFLISLIALLVVIISWLYIQNNALKDKFYPISKHNAIWYEFINSDLPNSLALGNYFFMYTPYKDYRLFVRDPRTNSIEEYNERIKDVHKDWLPLEFSFVLPSIATQLLEISPVLKMSKSPFKTTLSSEFTSTDFNENNVIYIGSYKSFYIFEELLPLFHINIVNDSIGYTLERTDKEGNIIETFQLPRVHQDNFYTDYSYIGKIKGPGNNTVLIISGGDNIGVTEAMKIILSPDFSDLLGEYADISDFNPPFFFNLILKTEGLSEAGFNHEIVFFEQLFY